jgi:hypothetical protein
VGLSRCGRCGEEKNEVASNSRMIDELVRMRKETVFLAESSKRYWKDNRIDWGCVGYVICIKHLVLCIVNVGCLYRASYSITGHARLSDDVTT